MNVREIESDIERDAGREIKLSVSSTQETDGHLETKVVPNSNYVVPLDKFSSSSSITRPLIEILRDLNKKIPDNIVKSHDPGSSAASSGFIPWFHANRMLNFYAPFVALMVRFYVMQALRESTGTVTITDDHIEDPVAAAEEIAFCRACARFGLSLYLYHEEWGGVYFTCAYRFWLF
ncbi:hypothetical protein DY000_02018485 [Brassica cretica]|uniref:Uncharacterized protein n=2 Tax=Brassica cretica TaxID=69181 RepID=A0ABQ7D8B9_BRACR|nr:hypothetical protein DY000_02018485 [Brassica cretica]